MVLLSKEFKELLTVVGLVLVCLCYGSGYYSWFRACRYLGVSMDCANIHATMFRYIRKCWEDGNRVCPSVWVFMVSGCLLTTTILLFVFS